MAAQFRLKADYSPAGDQPKAIEQLVEGMERGDRFQVLLGVTGSGKTYTMANVIAARGRRALVLTHNKTLAAQLYQEFKEFFPDNAVEYFVSYYDYYQPEAYVVSSDTFIEKDASINDEIDKLRLRATANLLTREDVIVVASVSCIYGLGSPREYLEAILRFAVGETHERSAILHDLVRIQYERDDYGLARGTFRARGDTIEIHPSYDDVGIRIELFGDEVERISRFHLVTGETLSVMKDALIAPAKHFVTPEEDMERILKDIRDEMVDRVAWFEKENKLLEAQRLSSRVRYDVEMLRETSVCPGIENYSRIMEGRAPGSRPSTLLDFMGDDWILFVDESHVSIPQVGGMFMGDRNRKQTLVDYGFRLPSALDNRPMNFQEWEATYPPNCVFVSATPADYELKLSGGAVVEQIIRPTGLLDPLIELYPVQGQIDVLLREIETVVARDERVLVTTLTKKMAQDLSEYLQGMGVQARYLHSEIKTLERAQILRSLRAGEFHVLVGINLLREGLDLPEVSLVAILDADKEGFLRNQKSLIQTMGRAARNVNGKVLLFADTMTDSLRRAIDETRRRRALQEEHNRIHGITPVNTRRRLEDDLRIADPVETSVGHALDGVEDDDAYSSGGESSPGSRDLKQAASKRGRGRKKAAGVPVSVQPDDEFKLPASEIEKRMFEASARLDFEEAARLRDLLKRR